MKKIFCLFFALILCVALTATVFADTVAGSSAGSASFAETEIAPETEIYRETVSAAVSVVATVANPNETVSAYTKSGFDDATATASSKLVNIPGSSVSAEAKNEKQSFMETWQALGYLDYIGDYYMATSGYNPQNPKPVTTTYTIYVKDGTSDAVKAQIAAVLSADAAVEWKSCRYSYNELTDIAEVLLSDFPDEIAYIQRESSQDSVYLGVYIRGDKDFDKAASAIRAKYPDESGAVSLKKEPEEMPDGIAETFAGAQTEIFSTFGNSESGKNARSFILAGAVLLALLLTGGLALTLHRNHTAVLSNGETVSASSVPTKKEVEEAIRKSEEEPSSRVYDEIMKKL